LPSNKLPNGWALLRETQDPARNKFFQQWGSVDESGNPLADLMDWEHHP